MSTTNTLDLNNRIDKLEKAVSGGDSAQANKTDIATEFSATANYTAGCFVYYGGKLYQFNADHAAGAWDPTDVVEANVTDQVVSNKSAIDGLTASDVSYDNTDTGLTATDVQGAVDELRQADNIMMSDGVTSVEDALDSGLGDVILKSLATSNREFTDFDTADEGGLYFSANYKTFNGAPQSTASDSCVLLVLNDSPYKVQICISTYQFNKIYIRYNNIGTWSAWKSISLA